MSDSTNVGIASIGAYVPRHRITADTVREAWGGFEARGIESTAVPAADEDTLTMAYEAAKRALSTASVEASAVEGLSLGTTTPPIEEGAVLSRLASMLGLPGSVETRLLTGSTLAGVTAVTSGIDAVEGEDADASATDGDGAHLAIASDAPRGAPGDEIEHAAGAGAAAVLLQPNAPGTIEGRVEYTDPSAGTRFRSVGETETTGLGIAGYDRGAYVDAITSSLSDFDYSLDRADGLVLHAPDGRLPYRAAGAVDADIEVLDDAVVVERIGDAGTANSLLGLADAIQAGTESLVLVGYGSGGSASALAIDGSSVEVETRGTAGVDDTGTQSLAYGEYLRMRGDITPGEPAGGGAYVSVPSWTRTLAQRHRLEAGECEDCGALAFPPEGACQDCGSRGDYTAVELPGTGTVEAATVIGRGGAPPEFVEQQARSGAYTSAVVALDGPGTDDERAVSVPLQVVGPGAGDTEIGDRVEATIRRLYTQEGVTRYGVKMLQAD